MNNPNATLTVSIATPEQRELIDELVWFRYTEKPSDASTLQAKKSDLSCASDGPNVVRLVVTQGDVIHATLAAELAWSGAAVRKYLKSADYTPTVSPTLICGRAASHKPRDGHPAPKSLMAFPVLQHVITRVGLEVAQLEGDISAVNVHEETRNVVNLLVRQGWQLMSIVRTSGVFSGPQVITYLSDVHAVEHVLNELQRFVRADAYQVDVDAIVAALMTSKV